jgi:hypothetical protein
MLGSDRENENGDIYVMNTDGSGVVKAVGWDKSNEASNPFGWSLDGTPGPPMAGKYFSAAIEGEVRAI